MKEQLVGLDKKIYQLERSFVGYLFIAMSIVVFIDVLHRVFSRSPGRLAVIFSGWFSMSPESFEKVISPLIIGATVFGVAYFAMKGHHRAKKQSLPKSKLLIKSLIVTIALSAVVQIFLRLDPEGIVWAPYFGLICLLWIGFIGASMATHTNQHLLLEMGEKIWPQKLLPTIRTIAHIVVGIFTFTVAWLAALSAIEHFHDYQSGPGAGLIPSIDWPKWLVYLVIPYAFGMMGIRFFGIGAGIFHPVKTSEF